MEHNLKQLKKTILKASISEDFNIARDEWEITRVWYARDHECVCGKKHIKEVNEIENKYTGEKLEVGSHCIKQFMKISISVVHSNLMKIRKDITRSVNNKCLVFFLKRGVINNWEYFFYSDIMRKRKLTLKQQQTKSNINRKILAQSQNKKEQLA